MTWLARLRGKRLQQPHLPEPVDGIRLTAAELERVLGVWTRLVQSDGDESDEQQAVLGQRVEKELQTFFGQDALQRLQVTRGDCGSGGNILLAADRLFVAFMGTRAAMAVTRKLYTNLQ